MGVASSWVGMKFSDEEYRLEDLDPKYVGFKFGGPIKMSSGVVVRMSHALLEPGQTEHFGASCTSALGRKVNFTFDKSRGEVRVEDRGQTQKMWAAEYWACRAALHLWQNQNRAMERWRKQHNAHNAD